MTFKRDDEEVLCYARSTSRPSEVSAVGLDYFDYYSVGRITWRTWGEI